MCAEVGVGVWRREENRWKIKWKTGIRDPARNCHERRAGTSTSVPSLAGPKLTRVPALHHHSSRCETGQPLTFPFIWRRTRFAQPVWPPTEGLSMQCG